MAGFSLDLVCVRVVLNTVCYKDENTSCAVIMLPAVKDAIAQIHHVTEVTDSQIVLEFSELSMLLRDLQQTERKIRQVLATTSHVEVNP